MFSTAQSIFIVFERMELQSCATILFASLLTWAATKIVIDSPELRYMSSSGGFMIVVIFLLFLPITRAIEGTGIRSIGSTIKPLELFVNLVLSTLEKLVRR